MKYQSGIATVELALIASVFLMILFGSIEVSRALFTWNTLDAVTQRAARVATVCPPDHASVKPIALFGSAGGTGTLLPGFTFDNLQIQYLDGDFADNGTEINGTKYVRAQIVGFQHTMAIPFISNPTLASPPFTTTIPRESLGYIPDDAAYSCFGAA